MYKVQVCEECGSPFDSTGYTICGDCNTQTFIKLEDNMKAKPKTMAGKKAKMKKVFKEFGAGTLNIGKSSKKVSNPKQAVAIALSQAGMSKKKGK